MQPGNSDVIVPTLSWSERIELEDERQDGNLTEPVNTEIG